jgi:starch synthase
MRYGTPPIVRATGGLIDTVDQYVEGTNEGTGFKFEDATALALANTIGWACATYYDQPEAYRQLQRTGIARDFSWGASAKSYIDAYQWAIAARHGTGEPIKATG